MDKLHFMQLWDIYKSLLTPTQQEITDLYFNMDLTVSEIAEEKGISRQGVSECLKNCKSQLEEFEEKLGFLKKLASASAKIIRLESWAEKVLADSPALSEQFEKLKSEIHSEGV